MGSFKRFEDIQAWQKARELTKELLILTSRGSFAREYFLRRQITSASISVMLNIAEGFGRKTNKDFNRFLVQAHGSLSEVQSALYIAMDTGCINQGYFDELYTKAEEISKMITGLIKYLKDH